MLNRKNIERQLAKYVAHPDAQVVHLLTSLSPMLLQAADLAKHVELPDVAISEDEVELARRGQHQLLQHYPKTIEPAVYRDVAKTLFDVLVKEAGWAKPHETELKAIPWDDIIDAEALKQLTTNPNDLMTTLLTRLENSEWGKNWHNSDTFEDVMSQLFYPALFYTNRVFLDGFASRMSQRMDARKDDVIPFDRPHVCPVCGSEPVIASVTETVAHGNTKKLHCTTCGAHWTYERMRCAVCGNQVTSDLFYVHDVNDDRHRLHICKACDSAFPTVFAGEDLNFNADVEEWVSAGLVEFYRENGYEMSEEEKANTERHIAETKADLHYVPEVVRRNKKQNYQALKKEREELEARRAQLKSMIENHDYSKDED